MSVRIITHCYASQLPQYEAFLRYQLTAILCLPTAHLTICYCRSDTATCDTIDRFMQLCDRVHPLPLSLEQLGRRSIGRNIAALKCCEDFVWFTDVDYVPSQEFISGISTAFSSVGNGVSLIYPRQIMVQSTHAQGDEAALAASCQHFPTLAGLEFIPQTFRKAIGGVQIVRGAFAREHGYLNRHARWQAPRTDGKPFHDFRDDVAYRKFCEQHGKCVGVELPGVYRIRHSKTTYPGGTGYELFGKPYVVNESMESAKEITVDMNKYKRPIHITKWDGGWR